MTKEEAQVMESIEAQRRGCESHAGGDDPDNPYAPWYVYYFEY
ncbi:MAG: hypothetical protein ACE5D0_10900 [Fidelibacterota bacterium]